MNIDVTEIVQKKINSLESEGVVEKAITETFEKAVIKAVTDSLDSYNLRNTIEKKMTEQVSKVVADLDFQSYNSFMIEKMSQIINETCREDICQKAAKRFKDLFLCQTEEIKLSTVYKRFREIACENVNEQDKYDRCEDGWHCKCELSEYGWLDCELDYENTGSHRFRGDSQIAFAIHRDYNDKTKGKILSLYLDGHKIEDKFKFGKLNDVELLLVQAAMNEIPIIIDIEDTDDIDNSFDVDY